MNSGAGGRVPAEFDEALAVIQRSPDGAGGPEAGQVSVMDAGTPPVVPPARRKKPRTPAGTTIRKPRKSTAAGVRKPRAKTEASPPAEGEQAPPAAPRRRTRRKAVAGQGEATSAPEESVPAPVHEVTTPGVPRRTPPRRKTTPGKPGAHNRRSRSKKRGRGKARRPDWRHVLLVGSEAAALAAASLIVIITALGRAAGRFHGIGLWSSILPFSGAVLGLAVLHVLFVIGWLPLRRWLARGAVMLPAVLALLLAGGAGWFSVQDPFQRELKSLRRLVGGRQDAERRALAHQVYAAYRRTDLIQMQKLLERVPAYAEPIRAAAEAFRLDPEVLVGVAAAESSFLPRDSADGGKGLFQITAPPKIAVEMAQKRLGRSSLDYHDHRHNAYVGAATFRHYLAQMRGDLFLGLLAYNIGPRNGGLVSIMQQYGAHDFVTVQPYLKTLPRDYPIRVLTAALAWRLWSREGRLPRYEEGGNAHHIQGVGIPGLTGPGEGEWPPLAVIRAMAAR